MSCIKMKGDTFGVHDRMRSARLDWSGCLFSMLLQVTGTLALGLSPSLVTAEGLVELWEKVVASNPTVKASEHTVEQARAQRDQALAQLLPNVGLKGYYSYNSMNSSVNSYGINPFGANTKQYPGYNGSLNISQALFDLPSYLKLQGAGKQVEQQEQYALAERMEIAYKMLDKYLLILESLDLINQYVAESKATEVQTIRLRKMNESQMAKVTDLYEVEAYGHSIETALIDSKNQFAIHVEELREITGTTIKEPDILVEEHFPPMKRTADEWVEEAMASNPLLLSLQYAAEASQQLIQSARAGHLPTASLLASDIFSNTLYNNTQTNGLDSYNIASVYLNVNIPIYSGGSVEAQSRESVQRYQISREKVEEVRRSIEKDIRSDWLNIETGSNRIASTKKEAEFRLKAKKAQATSYTMGTATIVEVLDTHKRLLKAETDYHKARYDYIRSLIRLRLHSGSLADFDLEDISAWFKPLPPGENPAYAGLGTESTEKSVLMPGEADAPERNSPSTPHKKLAERINEPSPSMREDPELSKPESDVPVEKSKPAMIPENVPDRGSRREGSLQPYAQEPATTQRSESIPAPIPPAKNGQPQIPSTPAQSNTSKSSNSHDETRQIMKNIIDELNEIDHVLK